MKRWLAGVLASVVVMLGLGSARAIDLRNEDETPYRVTVRSSAMSRDIELRGLTLSLVVCVGECTFEVPGLGSVRASRNDVVTIKDAKITAVPATPPTLPAAPEAMR